MIGERLGWAAGAAGGELIGSDRAFQGVSIDSRRIARDELFIAVQGPHFDAHEFVDQVRAQGAAGAVVERVLQTPLAQIVVEDSRRALGRIACAWRRRFDVPLVGISGSNGKTTVKTMLGAIFAQRGPALVTRGNLNNEIGVPLTLFELDPTHTRAVVEMGANHAGEIALLASVALPDVGLITNAAPAHLEGFGTLEGVARAKGELYSGLPEDGTAVLNVDDPFAPLWRQLIGDRRTIGFGLGADADVAAVDVRHVLGEDGAGIAFTLRTPQGEAPLDLALAGAHNATNAAAAAAAALATGEPLEQIVAGLQAAGRVGGRLNVLQGPAGSRLIDDSYNANPASLRAALDLLLALPGRAWIVLGDMAELGERGAELHAEFGATARRRGVQRLYTVGPLARAAAQAFGAGACAAADIAELVPPLRAELAADVNLLIKGSRCMRLERLVGALHGEAGAARAGC